MPSICGDADVDGVAQPRRREQLPMDEARVVDREEQAAEPAGLQHLDVDALGQHGDRRRRRRAARPCAWSSSASPIESSTIITATPMLKPNSRNSAAPRLEREVADGEERGSSRALVADDRAVAHVDDALRGAREILVVRDDDDRRAVGVQPLEQRDHLGAGARVELAGGLVGEEQRRPVGERARDGDALLLAAGQLRRAVALALREADVVEQLERTLAPLRAAPSPPRPSAARRSRAP